MDLARAPSRPRYRRLVAGVLSLSLLAAACGDDGDDTDMAERLRHELESDHATELAGLNRRAAPA